MNKEGVERAGVEPPRTPVVAAMCTALQAAGGADVNGGEALRGRMEETVEEEDVWTHAVRSHAECGAAVHGPPVAQPGSPAKARTKWKTKRKRKKRKKRKRRTSIMKGTGGGNVFFC